jgi:hypothetical protein
VNPIKETSEFLKWIVLVVGVFGLSASSGFASHKPVDGGIK